MKPKNSARTVWLSLFSALFLAACGGGSGGGSSTAQTATVGVALTDAPSTQWDEALATISSIELIGGPGRVVLFTGPETVDLLRLADYAELFAVREDVPIGTYSKIRLQLTDLELIDRDETGAIVATESPQIVGNGKMDLNPRQPILLAGGATVVITLDFDMLKSLKITETGSGKLIVRPVIFVDISTNLPTPGLARVHGEISELDTGAGTFRLCQTRLVIHDDDDEEDDDRFQACLRVLTNDATGLFGPDGLPIELPGLVDGDKATVIGRLRPEDGDDDDDDDDDDFDDQSVGDDDRFSLRAVTVEQGPLGTFRRVRGVVASAVDPVLNQFSLDAAPGQDPIPAGPITAQLFPKTRVFSETGVELDAGAIVNPKLAIADSVLTPGATEGDPDFLRTALVVLRNDLDAELVLRGSLVSVNAVSGELLVTTASGDRCVDAAVADIFLVDVSDGLESQPGLLADLEAGQEVRIFGSEGAGGCFVAETILAEADL